MSVTRTVTRQYQHVINVAKGGPVNARLQFVAPVASTVTALNQGSLVSLNSAGNFVLGAADGTATNCPMPMWSKKNLTDPDVVSGSNLYDSISGGAISAYVATGGFELETTEFTNVTYEANDMLVADTTTAGNVTKATGTIYTGATVVGIVSRGVLASDSYGISRLAFWPVFFPGVVGGGQIGPQGPAGADGVDAYVYVAYASDNSGTGFSLTPDDTLKYRAEIHTTEPIASPSASDFSGATWVKYLA